MRLEAVELRRVELPLVTPFRTAHGTETVKRAVLVRAVTDAAEGWGECVALSEPGYSPEHVDGAHAVLRDSLAPLLVGRGVAADGVADLLAPVPGNPMAKASLAMAVLDAELRATGTSLATHLGATRDRVPCGVAVGLAGSIDELLDTVAALVDQGYLRIKLKIEPWWDVAPVRAVRARFGDGLLLQVDANGAYTRADAAHLAELDALDLLLIEQPLAEDDLAGHAELARRIRTPVCLDESITSAATAIAAIELGACAVVNLKPGRVGGMLEAKRIHDECLVRGVPVWCGGMLETGLGRAANLALAALPGFTLPGDLSASARWFARDLTEPFVLDDGHLPVPTGPGIGVEPLPDVLDAATTSVDVVRPS
jgi:O-succinylbenzoate synthase